MNVFLFLYAFVSLVAVPVWRPGPGVIVTPNVAAMQPLSSEFVLAGVSGMATS